MTSLTEKSINNSLTRSNSAEIVGWVMPDYTTGLNISLSNNVPLEWTAPYDCYLFVKGGNNALSGVAMARIQLMDNTDISRMDSTGVMVAGANAFIPKGQTVKITASVASTSGIYFALKGV